MQELFDYLAGKMSHDEFETELNLNPELWKEIESLVPEDIADPDCPFRKLWGNMQLLETEQYHIEYAVNVFGYDKHLAYGLVKALILYHYPDAVCKEPPYDLQENVLEKIHMEYIGGKDVDELIDDIVSKTDTRRELKAKLKELFPCSSRKHPDWIQEPEWPAKNGVPMTFVGQKNTGERYEYTFCDATSGETETVVQYW